jgi:hypothetical protein
MCVCVCACVCVCVYVSVCVCVCVETQLSLLFPFSIRVISVAYAVSQIADGALSVEESLTEDGPCPDGFVEYRLTASVFHVPASTGSGHLVSVVKVTDCLPAWISCKLVTLSST